MSRRLRVVARLHAYPPCHNAGAEWMTHSMLRALVVRGHDVRVHLFRSSRIHGRYELDGVQVWSAHVASRTPGALAAGADVVLSHLEGVPYVKEAAARAGIPAVAICHNTHDQSFEEASGADLAVYNSQWMREYAEKWYASEVHGRAHPAPVRSLVVRPPVHAADYAVEPGDAVTLINLNENKGGHQFWELARRLPEQPFLGVRGSYGEQIVERADNVTVLPHVPGSSMRERVYARTRVLLALSEYESWGRVAAEAAACGIPTIAHPTPGLTECLGEAGVFVDRDDLDGIEAALRRLLKPRAWATASRRARARSRQLDPADELDAWCEAVEGVAR
ncbi:glycosyltransferase family 4 protein [Streptomyces chumphonensis]|uniref:glycosyltransferase family 4 protein n=1 Tax=Streptomyces chumphonensis TaxID=1214925 RepID=UPI003D75BAFD